MPTLGQSLPLASRFSKRSGSRESIQTTVRPQIRSLFVNPMPPRITEKSYRPRAFPETLYQWLRQFSESTIEGQACVRVLRGIGSVARDIWLRNIRCLYQRTAGRV